MLSDYQKSFLMWATRIVALWLVLAVIISVWLVVRLYSDQQDNYATHQEYQPFYSIFIIVFFGPAEMLWRGITRHPELITALATIAIGAFTFTLWRSTDKLWTSAERQARIANDTLEHMGNTARRELRAYLFIDGFPYFSHIDPDKNVWWSIHPIWRNGGSTPTRSATLNTRSELRDSPLPEDFTFPDAPGEPIKSLVGINSTIGTVPLRITGRDLAAVKDGEKFFYIWGWIRYLDVFAKTPERITRFCTQITSVTGNPTKPYDGTSNVVELTFSLHRRNNCMDDECP